MSYASLHCLALVLAAAIMPYLAPSPARADCPVQTTAVTTHYVAVAPPALADDIVRRLRRMGFDAIKTYNVRPPEREGELCGNNPFNTSVT